jgi:hypothetical protein
MKATNERPVCHRAEDLVTYLYNEANEAEARDFANHVKACDACRTELAVFTQVHDSISLWRNEALGSAFSSAVLPMPTMAEAGPNSVHPVQSQRGLSALTALRNFFSVSPLWLRAAMGFAALMLCVLAVLAISRSWRQPAPLARTQTKTESYDKEQFDAAVTQEVQRRMNELRKDPSTSTGSPANANINRPSDTRRPQIAVNRIQLKVRPRGLTRQEREQLAADLRLIPRDDDDLPFAFSEEPNQ